MRTVAAICRELNPDRRTDGELLAAFTSERSETAFLELVRRHGPLVWGACRRVLPDPADAEDAFQATFLVLVRRAGGLTGRDAIGPWLHRVAVWTARGARRKNARRLARQHPLPEHVPGPAPDPDLRTDLDGALLALPARYRDPIVLCHLQGFSRREAAERMGCAEGTLSAWLNRGLAQLRTRLRGLDPTKAPGLAVAVPAALAANTARAAASAAVAGATIPPVVSSIIEGVVHMFWIQKATAATCAMAAVFVLGVGVGLGTRPSHTVAVAQDGAPVSGAPPRPAPPTDPASTLKQIEKQIPQAQDNVRRAEKARKEAEDELRASEAELMALNRYYDRLKGPKSPPTGPEEEIAALEATIRTKEAYREELLNKIKLGGARIKDAQEKLEAIKNTASNPKDRLAQAVAVAGDLEDAIRSNHYLQDLVDKSMIELLELRDRLARLKGATTGAVAQDGAPATRTAPRADPSADRAKEIAALEEAIRKIKENHRAVLAAPAADGQKPPTTGPAKAEPVTEAERIADAVIKAQIKAQEAQEARERAEVEKAIRDKLKKQAEASAVELKALQDRLARLKGGKPAPGGPIDSNLMGLEELKAQLAKLEAERAQLLAQTDGTKRQLLTLEERARHLQKLAEALNAAVERAKPPEPATAAHIELSIDPKGKEFVIREVPNDPKAPGTKKQTLGPISTGDPAALVVLLTRAWSDPNGPREARVLVPRGAPGERVATAVKACKSAGFQKVTLVELAAIKPEPVDPATGKPRPENVLGPVELDEQLKRLAPPSRR